MYEKIAVLIDAENFSYALIERVLGEISHFGKIAKIKAYGDFGSSHLRGYKEISLNFHITPVQNFNYTTAKNSSDIALVIDAMDLLYSGIYDAFAIASNDSDFLRLSSRIRDNGVATIGVGKMSDKSVAYTHHICINKAENEARNDDLKKLDLVDDKLMDRVAKFFSFLSKDEIKEPVKPAKKSGVDKLLDEIKQTLKTDKNGFYNCGEFGSLLKQRYDDLKLTDYPKKAGDFVRQLEKEQKVILKTENSALKFKPKDTK